MGQSEISITVKFLQLTYKIVASGVFIFKSTSKSNFAPKIEDQTSQKKNYKTLKLTTNHKKSKKSLLFKERQRERERLRSNFSKKNSKTLKLTTNHKKRKKLQTGKNP
jgi:hypothetical protein